MPIGEVVRQEGAKDGRSFKHEAIESYLDTVLRRLPDEKTLLPGPE